MKKELMKAQMTKRMRGFTLVEMMISLAVGLVVLGAASQLFQSGMNASMMLTQRAETQQNVRTAINLISQDVSMAGSGMPNNGVALPNGGGATPSKFACNQIGTCYPLNHQYPTVVVAGPPAVTYTNHMYGLIPGAANGMEFPGPAVVPATGQGADSITVIYVDYSFPLNDYNITFPDAPVGDKINLTLPVPAPVPAPPAVDDPAVGIKLGDLILISTNVSGSLSAVGEVTGITPGGGTITFADADALNINQSGAAAGNISAITSGSVGGTVAYRIYAVTYFLEVPAVAGQLPRLMRQVNGQTAQPVADNIIALQFSYDMCDSANMPANVPACANIKDPIAAGFTPGQVHKVNISVMGQSPFSYGNHSQSFELTTSVSTRNLTFKDRYL
ncbi:MAG: prepilin-type N-terminal cleavage/methylation domain-containing protein [Acidobacteriales bacterium]|nr:prepilin-type N-terminal cleavage/methylation domain-containing protein [Terriglobales bacterium]